MRYASERSGGGLEYGAQKGRPEESGRPFTHFRRARGPAECTDYGLGAACGSQVTLRLSSVPLSR